MRYPITRQNGVICKALGCLCSTAEPGNGNISEYLTMAQVMLLL